MTIARHRFQSPRAARGTTLLVAIILLLLMSLVTLIGVSVANVEQRTSGNDLRAKLVNQVADAGINHATELMRLKLVAWLPQPKGPIDATLWERCQNNDESFPCGTERDATRRGNSYRFIGGTVDVDGDGSVSAIERRMMPLPTIATVGSGQAMTNVGAFNVRYGVGALLCRLDVTVDVATTPTTCTVTAADTGIPMAITLVSRAQVPGEGSSATLAKTVATYSIVNIPPETPPVVATGIVDGLGTATVVSNPNSGGPGIPISVWTRKNFVHTQGTWQTCQLGEFYANGTPNVLDGVAVCDACECPADATLSQAQGNNDIEGLDILDVDGNTTGTGTGALLDSDFFPCDLFKFVFGVAARRDTDNDGFCETHIDTDGDGTPDVQEWLETSATRITDCGVLDAESQGLYWMTGAACNFDGQVGSPRDPVIVISDAPIKLNTTTVYGVIYGRDPDTVVSATTGGDAGFQPGGGQGTLYGALIVEGTGTPNGNVTLVGLPDIFKGLNGLKDNTPVGEVPGAWTDRFSY
jgi:hypothetical protein